MGLDAQGLGGSSDKHGAHALHIAARRSSVAAFSPTQASAVPAEHAALAPAANSAVPATIIVLAAAMAPGVAPMMDMNALAATDVPPAIHMVMAVDAERLGSFV